MKICFGLLMFCLLSVYGYANKVDHFPQFPNGCFDQNIYCSETNVVEKLIDGKKQKVIQLNIYLTASQFDFPTSNDILDLFFDFDSWDEYADWEGSGTVRFNKSLNLGPIVLNGREIFRHYAHYTLKAPFPINRSTVRGVGYYWNMNPIPGADMSCAYENQVKGTFNIPGEPVLVGAEGFKHSSGEFHIRYDNETEDYYMFFTADIIPDINFLPTVAAPYIHAAFLAILKGMFGLR